MGQQEPQIKFSDDPVEILNKKFDKLFYVLFAVGFVFVITLIVMVITLLVDSFHFNSATYQEYSKKMDTLELLRSANEALLEENKVNQSQIIKNQEQIIKLIQEIKKCC